MNNIPKTMKAVVAYGINDYRLELEYPAPQCGDDDIIVKVEACGICAGDLKCRHGAEMFWGNETSPMVVHPPFIPGHEFFGTVVQTGKNVKNHSIGDRVISEQIAPCGECRFCTTGKYWMCQAPARIYGFHNTLNGGIAEYVRHPKEARLYKIPKEMDVRDALLIEPYGCAKHCVDRAQISNEDVVVISGSGALGLGMITYARLKNPMKLIALDLDDSRLERAREFGADLTINPGKNDAVEIVRQLTGGYGCDVYIEATGSPKSVIQGLNMIRKLGRFVEFSVFAEPVTVDWSIISDRKELDLFGVHLSPYSFPFVIDKIANGVLKTKGVVSSLFPIEEWETAFEHATGKYGDLKVAITF